MSAYELRVYRNVWCLYWRQDGQPRRRSLGTPDKLIALRRKAEAERIEDQQAASTLTVAQLWTRYAEYVAGRPAAKTMASEGKSILPHFGHLTPLTVNDATVIAYTALRRSAGRKDGTILTELNRLATALSWGVKRQLIAHAPHIMRPRRPPPKDRHLSKNEVRLLLDHCAPLTKLFVRLAVTTGAREQAILDLTWDRVDFERDLIDFRVAADRPMKERTVCPMNVTCRAALAEARSKAVGPAVVGRDARKITSVRNGVRAAAGRAGLANVTPHVFRHSAAVWMAEDNISMAEIAQFLGHSDSRVTERVYARFSPAYRRKAAGALEL